MTKTFQKLNLKDQQTLLILNAPESFTPELAGLEDRTIVTDPNEVDTVQFALAFVTKLNEVNTLGPMLTRKADGDAVIWFVYPKKTSKKYTSEINRDFGWDAVTSNGFAGVRMVAIDADWSALRFRNTTFIKNSKRTF